MIKFNRLRGGAGLLASAASLLAADEKPSQVAEEVAEVTGPDEEEVPPEASADDKPEAQADAKPAPAPAASEPAPAPAADAELTPRDREMQTAGRAEMHQRIETVFASEHVAGREQAAAMLLAADVPADKIVAKLSNLPKGAAAGDAMLKTLAETPNPSIDVGGEKEEAKADNHGWGKAHAKVSPVRSRGRK